MYEPLQAGIGCKFTTLPCLTAQSLRYTKQEQGYMGLQSCLTELLQAGVRKAAPAAHSDRGSSGCECGGVHHTFEFNFKKYPNLLEKKKCNLFYNEISPVISKMVKQ